MFLTLYVILTHSYNSVNLYMRIVWASKIVCKQSIDFSELEALLKKLKANFDLEGVFFFFPFQKIKEYKDTTG